MNREAQTNTDARILERYARGPHEVPPTDLDERILAASRRAAGSRPRAWNAWKTPVSLAAAVVLGFGLRLVLEPVGKEQFAAPAPMAEHSLVVARPASTRLQNARGERERRQIGELLDSATSEYASGAAVVVDREEQRLARSPATSMVDAAAAQAPAQAFKPSERVAPRALQAPPSPAKSRAARTSVAKGADALTGGTAVAKMERDAGGGPGARLEHIRRLLAEQRIEEALTELQAFRRDFPGYGREPEPAP